ncbi:hypothetical protein QE152_g33689 [Popillia japonica]|uniref:Uncharacterized protein n=1 Tax=Popillia japonica TaxID=7064 RepID=A0AAW1IWQ3_POPJA
MTKRKRPAEEDDDEENEEKTSAFPLSLQNMKTSEEQLNYIVSMRKRIDEMKDKLQELECQMEKVTSTTDNTENVNV